MDDVVPIELGRDLNGERKFSPGLLNLRAVRQGPRQITAKAKERFEFTLHQRHRRAHGVQAFLTRRLEPELPLKLIERSKLRLLGDADGALALNVGMAAHRHDVSARPADVSTKKKHVRDHLDILRAHELLCDAHAENAKAGLALRVSAAAFSISSRLSPEPCSMVSQLVVAAVVCEVLEAVRVLAR